MNEKDKITKRFEFKETYELNLTEFYKALDNAISKNNAQSIYGLSKIFTRYYFRKLNN